MGFAMTAEARLAVHYFGDGHPDQATARGLSRPHPPSDRPREPGGTVEAGRARGEIRKSRSRRDGLPGGVGRIQTAVSASDSW